jgi:hypothetical protein
MPLALEPGVVVIAELHEVESGLLREACLLDDLVGAEGFCGQLVTDLHVASVPAIR